MKCPQCGIEFKSSNGNKRFCSQKCSSHFRKGLPRTTPDPEKSLADWAREAAECNLDYGTYRTLRNAGKTFDELKERYKNQPSPMHASQLHPPKRGYSIY